MPHIIIRYRNRIYGIRHRHTKEFFFSNQTTTPLRFFFGFLSSLTHDKVIRLIDTARFDLMSSEMNIKICFGEKKIRIKVLYL